MKDDFKKIVKEIEKNTPREDIVSIVLFGSAVLSIEKAHDYDILVITKTYVKEWCNLAGKIRFNLMGKIDKPMDLIFVEEDDLRFPSPFIYEVSQKYQLLSGKDVFIGIKSWLEREISPLYDEGGIKIGWKIAV